MVDFSYEIINQIKIACDDQQVQKIIDVSLHQLHRKKINSFRAKRRYLMNMVMALKYTKAEGLPQKEMKNVIVAIEIFENLRKQEVEILF